MNISPRFKWLLAIIGLELLVVAGLLAWVWGNNEPVSQKQPAVTQSVSTKPPVIETKLLATGFTMPNTITSLSNKNDKRLYVVEQTGKIRIINAGGTIASTPLLDLSSKVLLGGEMGLLGLAFHPNFSSNGYLYVNYIDKNQNTIIARFTANKDGTIANPATEKDLIKLKQPYPNHNGGDLHFGPDGYLYIALGDGGDGGDPGDRAQNAGVMFGKILRIDVNSGDPYAIPKNNPFVGKDNAVPEIWDLGLRNPWRFSFDSKTGEMYIADVGQSTTEEVNLEPTGSKGGVNYGWRCFEGSNTYNRVGCSNDAGTYTTPILEYDHTENRCSITGGYVYRGATFPNMQGRYFFADYCGGQIYDADYKNNKWSQNVALTTAFNISAFGTSSNGELYLSDYKTGTIYQLIDTAK